MKKGLIVLAAVLIVAAFIPQTAAAAGKFNLGVKGGMSFAKVTFSSGDEPSISWDTLSKPVFGAFFAYNFSPMFSIQPEIYFLTQGGQITKTMEETEFVNQLVFSYIHVPVLAKVHIIKDGALKPILFAGPAISFLSTAVRRYYVGGVLDEEDNLKEFFSNTDFNLIFGGGLEYSMNKVLLILDVRYALGMGNISAEADTTIKTSSIMVMAGLGF